jgi:AcrR family transcriptional regulator
MAREKQMSESKELIEKSLVSLLKKKPLDSINMTEIASNAGVSRMTLYRHFEKKEEIILSIVEKKMEKIIDEIDKSRKLTMYDMLLFRFVFLKKSPFTKKLYDNNHLEELLNLIRERSMVKLPFVSENNPSQFLMNFLRGGIDGVTAKWIEDGMIIPPKIMAKRLHKLLTGINTLIDDKIKD